ncbi:MAG: phospholipase [Gammaproteobacteria bacterium]|nr:phospholipase [Gammaproteobacteria bacterium]
MADDATDVLLDATTALIPPLLTALDALLHAGRYLNPPDVPALAKQLAEFRGPLARGFEQFQAAPWPEHLEAFQTHSEQAAGHALQALDGFAGCAQHNNPTLAAYRAMGACTRALEALYPVAFMLPPVNRFYLSEARRQDETLQEKLLQSGMQGAGGGVIHADNAAAERGGFSLYVPEYHDPATPAPLVVALHGGSGHGRSFLWTWLIEARSRGVIVLAPTARDDTWSLMGPDVDTPNLLRMLDSVKSNWRIDDERMLLTGMSDGGTFAYLAGLRGDSPFTHLAPVSAAFHPMLLEGAGTGRLAGLPVYLVHGALDWMFPVDVARMARDALTAAGADVVYRELADLSHTYPREENARILGSVEWGNGGFCRVAVDRRLKISATTKQLEARWPS